MHEESVMTEQQSVATDYRDPRELRPHPDNPRGEIDPATPEIIALSADIAKHGVLQPLVISSTGVVHIGHRRRIAAISAGLDLVPVVIRDLKGGEFVEEIFLAENMQRQDLSPLEEARAIDAVRRKLEKQTRNKITKTELTRRLQIPEWAISCRLCILDLPERVQKLFHALELPLNSSYQLSRLKEWPQEVERFADRLLTRQLTLKSLPKVIDTRIRDLQQLKDNEAILAREPKMRAVRRAYPENSHTPALTRDVVIENLTKKGQGTVSLFNLSKVLDTTCCSCGMMGNNAVCLSCPLPRFVNGLLGRADITRSGGIDRDDEDID